MELAKKGRHVDHPAVRYMRVKRFTLHTRGVDSRDGSVNVDGELSAWTPFTAAVVPKAIKVFVSASLA